MKCLIFGIIISTILTVESIHNASKYIQICHKSDPLLNECMKGSLEKLKPYLKTGVPELSIPSFEPLVIPEISINQGRGSFKLQITFTNFHVWGLSKFNISRFKANLKEKEFQLKMHFPQLNSQSLYKLDGKILMLDMNGDGIAYGNYNDVDCDICIQGETKNSNGLTFYQAKNVSIDLNVINVKVNFTNLIPSDTEIGDAMNTFLNDNWKHIMVDLKPILQQSISEIVKDLFNSIYSTIPIEEILPY